MTEPTFLSWPLAKPADLPSPERFAACLLGGALGDALGWPVEFRTVAQIDSRHGAGVPHALIDREITDDTQMTLFTAEGLIRSYQQRGARTVDVPETIRRAYIRWYQTQNESVPPHYLTDPGWLMGVRDLNKRMAPGNTCLGGLQASIAQDRRFTPEAHANDSDGCGAVMRMAPVGLVAANREDAFTLGQTLGAISHGGPNAYLPAGYLASLIHDLSRGIRLSDAITAADDLLARTSGAEGLQTVLNRVRRALPDGKPSPDTLHGIGGAWDGHEALGIALICVLTADLTTPEGVAEALWRSVRHNGDSDSTGAIAGNLIGCMVGLDGLPQAWLAELAQRDLVAQVAADLHRAASGEDLDRVRYPAS